MTSHALSKRRSITSPDVSTLANTVFHANGNGTFDTVYVTNSTGEGHAALGGRITVIMTGTFGSGMSFVLTNIAGGRDGRYFDSESIIYQSNHGDPCITPVITYYDYADGSSQVFLEIHDCD